VWNKHRVLCHAPQCQPIVGYIETVLWWHGPERRGEILGYMVLTDDNARQSQRPLLAFGPWAVECLSLCKWEPQPCSSSATEP
jgi:hypothetical protein